MGKVGLKPTEPWPNLLVGADKLTYFSWRSGVLLRFILMIRYKSGG